MNPCPNSPDKKHNVAHPDYPCIYGCGFGGKKLKPILEGIDYRPVKEKGIVTQAYEFFGKQIPYPRLAMIKKKIGDQAFREYLSCSKHDKPKNPIAYFLWATSDNIKKTWAAEKETNINPNHPPYKGYKNMKEEVKISQKTLEDLSLKALAQHCPLCGVICENLYCKECGFKYEEGKLYFSSTRPLQGEKKDNQ